MPSPENQWLLIGLRGVNCGFGPLRNNVPRSSRGRPPVTGRCGASHSIEIGAKLPASQGEGVAAVVTGLTGAVPRGLNGHFGLAVGGGDIRLRDEWCGGGPRVSTTGRKFADILRYSFATR